jgi:hypothetical protein
MPLPEPDPEPEPEGHPPPEPPLDPLPLAGPEPDPLPLAEPEADALPEPSQSSLMSRTSAPSSLPQAAPRVTNASEIAAAVMSRLRGTCPPGVRTARCIVSMPIVRGKGDCRVGGQLS